MLMLLGQIHGVFFAAVDGVNPTTVIGLLSLVITAILAGVGWAGKRLLGPAGLMEKSNEAQMAAAVSQAGTNVALEATAKGIESIAACIRQHDANAISLMSDHSEECRASGIKITSMHSAALMGLDELEHILVEHGISCEDRIQRIREELKK